jgi:iron-regulated transporter 1
MRRIDLFCKLAGPLFVSVLTIPSASFAAIFLAASNVLSLPFEYYFIHVVHKRFPDLAHKTAAPEHVRQPLIGQILQWPKRTLSSWKIYYQSPLFAASLSLCILYFTVLSFGGTLILNPTNEGSMIAFLSQYADFSTPLIAGLRAIAVAVGIAATFLSSPVIRWIGPVRSGIWFLSWQTIFLAPVPVILFLSLSKQLQGGFLVGFVSISRLGLWGFDLSEQYLVQQVALIAFTCVYDRKLKRRSEASFQQRKRRCSRYLMCYSIHRRSYSRNHTCSSILS